MKNFTNNFKQFTSRLSARWLIMALMLLLGTSSAWGETYLSGTFNGWNASDNNYKFISGTLNVSMSPGTYEFKVVEDGKWYSMNNTNITGTVSSGITMYENNNNNKITITYTGVYTFTWDGTNNKLKVTYPPQCTTCCNNNYVAGNTELTGYNWDPGQNQMTCSNNLYSKTFTNVVAGTHQFKITNGSWGWSTDNITTKSGSNYLSLSKDGGNIKFTTTSIYNITIYFDGNGCYATYESACTPPAAPTLNPNSTTVCSGTSFKLPGNHRWYTDATGGTKLTSNTISSGVTKQTFYYAEAGEDGCVSTTRTKYTVNVDAKPAITLASPSSICTGTEIDLTKDYVTSKTGTVTWYSDANRSQEITNGIVTPINTGTSQTTNTYYAKVTNGVCSAKTDVSLSIKVDPQSAITLKEAPTICQGTTITFANYVNTSTGTVTWHTKSDFSDAAITSAKPDATTTYYAKATSGNCAPATASLKVIVDAKPAITLKSAPTICNGTTVTFANYVNTHTGTVTWHTDANCNEAAITSATPSQTTTYYVKATNGVCDPVTSSLKVTVSEKPKLTLKAAPTICNGATIAFPDYVDNNNTIGTVSWYLDEDRTQSAGVTAKPSQTTTYYAKAVNSPCAAATAQLAVTVNDKPTVPTLSADKTSLVSPDKATLTAGNTTNGLTYTLYNGETPGESQTSTGGSLIFKVGEAGNYTVRVSNSCGTSTSDVVTITVCTPQTNEFRHANSSYTQLANQPTYYPGDKAYFVSTIDCCLTGTWSNNLQKGEEGWWTGLTGKTPKFSMTLTRAGEFTITNMATNGCTQDKNVLVNLDFTVTALSQVTNANGTASGADIALTWKHSANHTKVMVVRYPTAGTETIPAGGQSYSEGNTLGEGSVVYVGTSESYTDKNLPSGESYKYYFYTVNNNYYSNGVVLNMSSCPIPAKPSLSSTAITACNGECTAQGYIIIGNMGDYKDDTYTFKLGNSKVNPDANGKLGINSTAFTQYTVTVTNSCGNSSNAQVDIAINDKTPTISGKTITQPGKDNAIQLTLPAGISAKWSVEPNTADLSVNEGNSTKFSAEVENDYVITANNDGCIDTHNVKVSTAFLIWVRRPMSGHASYENIYSGTSEKGSALYLEQTTSGQTYTSVDNVANRNSSAHNKIEPESSYTDCEGATWDIFRTTPEMALAGAKFYVAAKNDEKTSGYATYTKDYTFANGMTADAYFTIGGHTSGNKGSEIVLSEQPLPTNVYSSGDAKFNANNFADFVPLYVVDCSGNEVDSYQWQFSATIDGTYTNYSSECSYVGKKTETTDAGESNNIRVKEDGYYRCIVTYKDGKGTSTSNSIKVTNTTSGTPGTLSFTSKLPIIMVNTNDLGFPVNNFGGTPSKNADKMKEKMSVDVKIYEGSTLKYDRKARMNYRGSSSLNFLKKSYAFCPGKADCVEDKGRKDYVKTEKLNMLDIGKAVDKDWVLYAAAADPSLMRNRLMFDTFRDMTSDYDPKGWSVQSRYVELIVDGEYKGVYVMMDKITANKDRVNVEWKLDANGNTTQEAFIVKFDKTDKADRYEITSGDQKTFKSKYSGHDGFDTYDTNIDQRFEVEYPEKEDIEDGKGKWSEVFNAIENKINKFEEELAKGNFSEVQKLIDYTSWADWFIITEFAKNIDGYRASNLFVYDGSKPNAKIEARPLWDQELSFNNQCPSYYADYLNDKNDPTKGLLIDKNNSAVYNNDASAPFWFTGKYKGDRGKYNGSDQTFKGLLDDPCFVAEVQARWAKHVSGALSQATMTAKVTKYKSDLGDIATSGTPMNRELTFWKNKSRATIDCGTGSGCYGGTTGYSAYNTQVSITNSATTLTNWLTGNRRANLGNIINGWEGTGLNISLTITPETGITTPWEAVMVQVNNPSGYDYDLEYTTNTLDKVSGVIINENNDKYTYRIPRPEDWKPGDEDKEGERTDIQYGIKATLKVGEGVAQCGNSSQAPSATTTITLKDEDNEDCQKP